MWMDLGPEVRLPCLQNDEHPFRVAAEQQQAARLARFALGFFAVGAVRPRVSLFQTNDAKTRNP